VYYGAFVQQGDNYMTYEAKDIFYGIKQGIMDFSGHIMRFEYPEEVPHPEYLTTSSIAFALAKIGFDHQPSFSVKCEELTRRVWNGSTFKWFMHTSRSLPSDPTKTAVLKNRQRDSNKRKGQIDITLSNADKHPFAIVETKGELIFQYDEALTLYKTSLGEMEKDLVRNAEYVLETGPKGGVQYSAFTFYLKDKSSVLEADAPAYIKQRKTFFTKFLTNLNLNSTIKTHVHIGTFSKELYQSREDALEPNHHGAPAQDMYPAWHIAYGIISFYVVGNNITDTNGLSTMATE
jgi:hypothetical protein